MYLPSYAVFSCHRDLVTGGKKALLMDLYRSRMKKKEIDCRLSRRIPAESINSYVVGKHLRNGTTDLFKIMWDHLGSCSLMVAVNIKLI